MDAYSTFTPSLLSIYGHNTVAPYTDTQAYTAPLSKVNNIRKFFQPNLLFWPTPTNLNHSLRNIQVDFITIFLWL
jgi:hypothetical protein